MTREEYQGICDMRFGKEVYEKLAASRVAVAGLGGLGSHIAVMLARSCVGTLHLIDFDVVDISNLNRQEYYVSHIGRPKTECLREKLKEINPFIQIITDQVKVTEENLESLFREETIVCEAFDSPEAKAMLVNGILEKFPHIRLVSGSGMAGYGDANIIKTRKVFKNFYICGDEVSDSSNGVGLMAPRVSICAGHEANKVIQLILEQ
ncbi:MAG: thiamine biosynthesis protein ThiF [Lachnospiraceae bacterium]|nr:thiamine biosynthesis protein ThiF [Lachnospiraceae bacterium]